MHKSVMHDGLGCFIFALLVNFNLLYQNPKFLGEKMCFHAIEKSCVFYKKNFNLTGNDGVHKFLSFFFVDNFFLSF